MSITTNNNDENRNPRNVYRGSMNKPALSNLALQDEPKELETKVISDEAVDLQHKNMIV